MRRKVAGRVYKPKYCAFCGVAIAEARPVFLVTSEEGSIIGPYHAGCAEKLAIVHKGKRPLKEPRGDYYGRIIPAAREETLPW